MMLFRSHSLKTFFNSFVNIFKRSNSNIFSFGLETFDYIILIIYVVALLIIGILQEKNKNIYESFSKKNILIRYFVYIFIIICIVLLGIYGEGYDTASFIYGQF